MSGNQDEVAKLREQLVRARLPTPASGPAATGQKAAAAGDGSQYTLLLRNTQDTARVQLSEEQERNNKAELRIRAEIEQAWTA